MLSKELRFAKSTNMVQSMGLTLILYSFKMSAVFCIPSTCVLYSLSAVFCIPSTCKALCSTCRELRMKFRTDLGTGFQSWTN